MRLMCGSHESEMISRRAEEISVVAKRATEENRLSYKSFLIDLKNQLAVKLNLISIVGQRKIDTLT